jgi:hypothetical protein
VTGDRHHVLQARTRAKHEDGASRFAVPGAVGVFYALLVGILWLPFGIRSGMGYETTLVYLSEDRSFVDGFFYPWDPLRRFTVLFYHVGYHLSNALGVDGSFLGNQIVYASLWWGRGFLVFLIVRRLFPAESLLAYVAGALVVAHASDGALNWVGQLNQFGVIFWALLAIYLLVVALQQASLARATLLTVGASGATYLCLWSYESPVFVLVLTPVLLLWLVGLSRRAGAIVGGFYIVPLVFTTENLQRYVGDDNATYQESVLRDGLSPVGLLEDLAFNVSSSTRFWDWDSSLPATDGPGGSLVAGVAAAAVFTLGAMVVASLARRREEPLAPTTLAAVVGAGLLLVIASFPAYLVLADARSLWRTQFLSGIGFGVGVAALLLLAATRIGGVRARLVVVAAGGALVAYAGGSTAYRTAALHFDIWERHREAIAQVLEVAPRVNTGTVVVLTNVSRDADPFGHNMWFDVALRLAYPQTPVAGVYFFRGGEPAPGANLVVRGAEWKQVATGFPTLIPEAPFSSTVIVRLSPNGQPVIATTVPSFLRVDKHARRAYNPSAVVRAERPSPAAIRRYAPDEER